MPSCCGYPMRQRTNRTTGVLFWGCVMWPNCQAPPSPPVGDPLGSAWRSKDGRTTLVIAMADDHLKNTIALLNRTNSGHPALAFMEAEQERRTTMSLNDQLKQAQEARKVEKKMTTKERAKEQMGVLGSAAAEGMAAAAVIEGGDLLLDLAQAVAMEEGYATSFVLLTHHPLGREAVKVAVAVAIHSLCTYTDLVPKEDLVARVAALQVRESMRSTTQWVVKWLKSSKTVTKHFERLAQIGERLPENTVKTLDFFQNKEPIRTSKP